jgi:hypothetical protein
VSRGAGGREHGIYDMATIVSRQIVAAGLVAVLGCSASDVPEQSLMVTVPFEQAKFVPVSAARPNGAQLAVLHGDPSTGPSAMLMKLVRGPVPLHTHSADYHLVLIRGSMKHWGAGEAETTAPILQPGSYWFQPGGKVHGDSCLDAECLVHVVWSGPRDGKLAPDSTR